MPETPLAGTTVLLTAGNRGLGRVYAEALIRQGANLAVTARRPEARDELSDALHALRKSLPAPPHEGPEPLCLTADVTDAADLSCAVEETTARFGAIDVLVNNAGATGPAGPAWDVDLEQWWQTMETNVRGTMLSCRAVIPGMLRLGRGRIINIVSNAGRFRWPYASAYSVSKAALIKLAENMAVELRRHAITILSYHPGLVKVGIGAEFQRGTDGANPWADGIADWLRNEEQAGRYTDPEATSAMLIRLIAGEADALSGAYLTPDSDLSTLLAAARPGNANPGT